MTDKLATYEDLWKYYLDMRESLCDKMKTEDHERANLKFKIAALIIYEMTHSMPEWFKDYLLASVAGIYYQHDESLDHIAQMESQFHSTVADYLLKMEQEANYAKRVLGKAAGETEKKAFWKPIVFDAFLIAGIYFTPSAICRLKKSGSMAGQSSTIADEASLLSKRQLLDGNHSVAGSRLSIAT